MAMADKPRISDAEWHVMQVLWEKSPLTVKEVIEILSKKTAWKSETIRTLVNRLTKKKAIDFEKKGRRHYFYPLLSQEECVKAEADSFLARSGAALLKPILTRFIEKEQLSDEEIAELQRILEKQGGRQ
jgi:BlaI family penicillinase repressor